MLPSLTPPDEKRFIDAALALVQAQLRENQRRRRDDLRLTYTSAEVHAKTLALQAAAAAYRPERLTKTAPPTPVGHRCPCCKQPHCFCE